MGKQRGLKMCDLMLLILGTTGSFMGLLASLFGHYRNARQIQSLSWPIRKYYIKKLTDKSMAPSVTWKSLKQDVCAKYEAAQMKYGNPQGMAIGKLMENTITIPMCSLKAPCRDSMAERCIFYDYAVDDSMIVLLTNAASLLFLGLAAFFLMISRKPHWKMYAGVAVFLGGFIVFAAVGYWGFDTNKYMRRIAEGSIWPYAPLNGWGFFCNMGGAFNLMMAGVCGFMSSLGGNKSSHAGDMGADPLMAGPMGGQPLTM